MNTEFGQKDDETLVYEERVSCDGGQYGHPKIFYLLIKMKSQYALIVLINFFWLKN